MQKWFSFNSIHSMWKCRHCIFSRMPEIRSIYFKKDKILKVFWGSIYLERPSCGPHVVLNFNAGHKLQWVHNRLNSRDDWSRSAKTQAERVMQSKSKIDLKDIPCNSNLNFKQNWNYFNGSCEWNKVLKASGKFYSQRNFNLTN